MSDILAIAASILAGLFLLDRLFLWFEARGWMYWRRTKSTGSGAGQALLELQRVLESDKVVAVQEAKLAGERVSPDPGGDPTGATEALRSTQSRSSRMTRQLIGSGSTFEQEIGYSRAVVDGNWVFVSGTTGFDYSTMTIPDSLPEQTEQCLRNIEAALRQAGSSLKDVVRVTYVLPSSAEFPECWPILRRHFGEIRPAAMMISAGLSDPRMRIEIEVTALKQSQ